LVAGEFGFELQLDVAKTGEDKLGDVHRVSGDEGGLEFRPPVVTVMGHVDHGKTSLLDAIRKTSVAAKEHGGITQHIGAYMVKHGDKKITFIDTPGHAAFEKMRARGAKITDIAILLVAGDDGVMPQTVEAIKHIQKNKLPMIVAVNKMDKKEANIERVKEQLSAHNVLTEEWGGDAILVPISAMTGMGIDKLLEMILLVAEMNGYRANPNKEAQGAIIDARRDATQGAIVTVLVQSGTMRIGDMLLAGTAHGKVKRMTDENGKAVKAATPGMPVQVLGFSDVPKAGDMCYVVDEKLTKQVVLERKDKEKLSRTKAGTRVAADIDAIARLDESAKKQLNVIVKGDVSGSVEAIVHSIQEIQSDEVRVNVISSGVGVVNDNDVTLAEVADALLIAFHVKPSATAANAARKQKIQIHSFNVIYQIFDFVTEQMVRLFTPKFTEVEYGKAEVRAIFKSTALGQIAGSMVTAGQILRGTRMRLVRGGKAIGEYGLASLKIKKDDVKEVAAGFECGIKLDDSAPEIAVGDVLECVGKEQQPIVYNGRKYEF
jgi:translation initiation factor IF-2